MHHIVPSEVLVSGEGGGWALAYFPFFQDDTKVELSGVDDTRVFPELDGGGVDVVAGFSPSVFVGSGNSSGRSSADTAVGPSVSALAGFADSGGPSHRPAILDLMGLEVSSVEGVPEVSGVPGSGNSGLGVDPLASVETEVAVISVDLPEEAMPPGRDVLFTTSAMDNGIVTFNPTRTTFGGHDSAISSVSSRSTLESVRVLTDSSGQSSYFGVSRTAVSSTPLVGPAATRVEMSESFGPSRLPTVPMPLGQAQVNFSVASSRSPVPPPDRIMRNSTDVTDKVASKPVKKTRTRMPQLGPSSSSPPRTRAGTVRGEAEAPGLVIIGLRSSRSNESAGPGVGSEPRTDDGAEDLLA